MGSVGADALAAAPGRVASVLLANICCHIRDLSLRCLDVLSQTLGDGISYLLSISSAALVGVILGSCNAAYKSFLYLAIYESKVST